MILSKVDRIRNSYRDNINREGVVCKWSLKEKKYKRVSVSHYFE